MITITEVQQKMTLSTIKDMKINNVNPTLSFLIMYLINKRMFRIILNLSGISRVIYHRDEN